MPAAAAVHIVTGVPFSGTFPGSDNTFTVPGNFTSMFSANGIITVLGGAPNGGYRQVVSAVFGGGVTTVTSTSYSTGTAYPGPATFTTGSGTVLVMDAIAPPPSTTFQFVVGGPNSTGPLASGTYHGDGTGYFTGALNGGFTAGSIIPDPTAFMGGDIVVCGWQGNGPPAHGFVLAVSATLAQNAFTTLTVGAPANYSLTSASASHFDSSSFPGYTIWIWSSVGSGEFSFLGDTLTVTLS